MFATGLHVLVSAVLLALAFGLRPDEAGLVEVGPAPRPALLAVTGLEFDATVDLPALAAERATPDQGRSPLTLGDLATGLLLEMVAIECGDGVVIRAAVGRLGGGPLELEDVRVKQGSDLILRGSRAQVWRGVLRCHGLAVLRPGGERETVLLDQECELDRLAALAR